MLIDPLHHELPALKTFYKCCQQMVERAQREAGERIGSSINEEWIEEVIAGPFGPLELDQHACRAIVGEMNALVEGALQILLTQATGLIALEDTTLVVGADKRVVREELVRLSIDIRQFAGYATTEHVSELCNSFKHRQRLRPFPKKAKDWHVDGFNRVKSKLPGNSPDKEIQGYAITLSDLEMYLDELQGFLAACQETGRRAEAARKEISRLARGVPGERREN
jgi:hypothetical protein